jgi:hypothetical protein
MGAREAGLRGGAQAPLMVDVLCLQDVEPGSTDGLAARSWCLRSAAWSGRPQVPRRLKRRRGGNPLPIGDSGPSGSTGRCQRRYTRTALSWKTAACSFAERSAVASR